MSRSDKTVERWRSDRMHQDITLARWGHYGVPVLVFPTAGGDAEEVERHHLVGHLGALLDDGRIKVYSCDSVAGRAMTAHETASLHRVHEALAGTRELSELTAAEGRLFDAEIDARLADGLARTDYAEVLAARGVTTVVLDDEGRLVEQRPDGSRRVLDDA